MACGPCLLLLSGDKPGNIVAVPFSRHVRCPRGGRFYEANRYVVTKVDVNGTLDIAAQLRKFANGSGLPIHGRSAQTGGSDEHFNYLTFLESASLISGSLAVGYKVSLALVVPVLEDCDETAKTLAVVYRVYHLGYPGVPSGTAYSLQTHRCDPQTKTCLRSC